ncbi:MAG: hybrid sensor histidine kinase/response regulator [Chitinophagaceae bacterium]|nr:hybrid sensor histidine kinase/response regulator [Chitinophagaceae bacterium]
MNFLSATKTIAGKLLRIGTTDLQDQDLVKRITIVNTLCLTFSTVLIIIMLAVAVLSGWESALLFPLFIELLLNNLVLVANHYRQHSLAATWLFLLQCGATMYFGNLLGSGAQLQFAIVYQIAVVYLIFPTRLERRFCIACSFIALCFLELNFYNSVPGMIKMSPQVGLLVHTVVIIAVLAVIMIVCRPYVQNNDHHTAFVKADHYKKVYLYQVTHDLKTPLHIITVAASLIRQELKKKAAPRKVEDLLEQLQAAGISANTLVNNVLTMAEIEAGKMETPESGAFIVREFFTNIVHVHKVIAGTRNIKLKLFIDQTLPEMIISDSLKLNQITTNLLSNAIKHAHRNSTVEMDVLEKDDRLQIRVSNHGQGIPPELQEHLFNPFATGGCKHRRGTGLGLYIVKTKLLSMGGLISVSSEPDGLTCFTVTLPLQEGWMNEEAQINELAYQPPAYHTHVLLAGPLQHPQGLQKLPETMGCRVSRAADGNEVLAMVSHDMPDVIILDSHLSAIDATEVLHRLKKNAILKAIPVLITARQDRSDTQLEAAADGVIGDQFNYRQMYQVLSPFVQSTQQQFPVSNS